MTSAGRGRSQQTKKKSEHDLHSIDRLQHKDREMQQVVNQETLRAFITAQVCIWCGAGPFKVLASHTRNAHGISAFELRDLAGLMASDYIASEENREMRRRRVAQTPGWQGARTTAIGQRRYTAAGLEAKREQVQALDRRYERTEAQRASLRRTQTENMERRQGRNERIVAFLTDTDLSIAEISAEVGLGRTGIRAVARRHGIEYDGRSRRKWQ